jgi:hypothetical protein
MVQGKEGEVGACLNFVKDIRVAVVCLGFKIATKGGFRVSLHEGPVEAALVVDEKGLVVADDFGAEADAEKEAEDNEAVKAAPVGFEPFPAPYPEPLP